MLRASRTFTRCPCPHGQVSNGGQSVFRRMSDANGTIVVSSSSQANTTVHVTDSAGKSPVLRPYNAGENRAGSRRERLKT
ncbi:MAG: hypothetical protein ACLT8E_09260 [Akkermansia sp.]